MSHHLKQLYIIAGMLSCSLAAQTFVVTKTTDTYPNGTSGELRWAIQQANKTAGTHRIEFNIEGDGPHTITPVEELDTITHRVTIDGYTQPGAIVRSQTPATLMIEINGNNYATGNPYKKIGNGLAFSGKETSGSKVRGIVINEWINAGIAILNTKNISISGCYLGTNTAGTQTRANQSGIYVYASSNITIGYNTEDLNLIAGSFFYFNDSAGIVFKECKNCTVINNYLGLTADGLTSLDNSQVGIECIDSDTMTIQLNQFAGHSIMGVSLIGTKNSEVRQNYFNTGTLINNAIVCNGNIGISLCGSAGKANSTSNNLLYNNYIVGTNVGVRIGYASSPGSNFNQVEVGTMKQGNIGAVITDNNNIFTYNTVEDNEVGGILLHGPTSNTTITNNIINNHQHCYQGYGIQLGLPGSLSNGSNNTIENNNFGSNNGVITVCSRNP